ncbi:hypothetical protein F4561_001468 [Lipingzhangella halophila]|uniref:Uncharacterized protein n=1 Tax=Lipingzhangella halophila TaxID=1783352 RepID=A0A7W7RER7_9ACTN|nr:hypothetical protein [Lipingzhangella halophila]MBB4930648.1 hypothetical protein [Lipingzhangella halophila]
MSTLVVASPLQALEESFRLLAQGPGQPYLAVGEVHELTCTQLAAGELALVLREGSAATRDGVWRALVRQARAEQSTWVVLAAGLALPGLRAVVARWGRRQGVNREDLAADVLAQFLEGLWQVDLAAPHVCRRLCYSAEKAARRHYYQRRRDRDRLAPQAEDGLAAPVTARHPEQVLAQAAQAGVLTWGEAELIARSRLEWRSLASAAAELGVAYGTAKWRRRCAETRLAAWITDKENLDSC